MSKKELENMSEEALETELEELRVELVSVNNSIQSGLGDGVLAQPTDLFKDKCKLETKINKLEDRLGITNKGNGSDNDDPYAVPNGGSDVKGGKSRRRRRKTNKKKTKRVKKKTNKKKRKGNKKRKTRSRRKH